MKAILIDKPGGADQLYIGETEKPIPQQNEVLVKVKATALNRADILQREGKYPPPKGASEILGLEIAGMAEEVGTDVSHIKKGDSIFGLLPGGGYAEYAIIHKDMAMQIPESFSFTDAAAIPEVFLTAYQALFLLAHIKKGDTVLIHAGASGVGTAAIQLAKSMDAYVIVTASAEKHDLCKSLGADVAIDYKKEDFAEQVFKNTSNKGADIIVDFIGAPYFEKNLNCAALDGRIVMLAFLGGTKISDVNLRNILARRLSIHGSTLRSRNIDYQISLTKSFKEYALEKFKNGNLKPVIDKIYSWENVQEAHQLMEANKNAGKIILEIK